VRKHNGKPEKRPVTLEELLVSSLAQTDALAKLLIEKGLGLITREEFMERISEERATYQRRLNPTATISMGEHITQGSLKDK